MFYMVLRTYVYISSSASNSFQALGYHNPLEKLEKSQSQLVCSAERPREIKHTTHIAPQLPGAERLSKDFRQVSLSYTTNQGRRQGSLWQDNVTLSYHLCRGCGYMWLQVALVVPGETGPPLYTVGQSVYWHSCSQAG